MINLVIAHSQQAGNRCVMGDTEQDHMTTIAKALYDQLLPDKRFNLFFIPKLNLGSDSKNLVESTRQSNEFMKKNGGTGYHLELHSDAGYAKHGASGLYYTDAGKQFISPIFDVFSKFTPWEDVGLRQRTDLYALKNTAGVAAILEISFHDQKDEAQWIHNNVQKIAETLKAGILKTFKLEPVPVTPAAPVDTTDWKQKYNDLKAAIQAVIAKG